MTRALCLLLSLFFSIPNLAWAGYIFHKVADTGQEKIKMLLWIEGANKRIDTYFDDDLQTSMIIRPGSKEPLYVMHPQKKYMTQIPDFSNFDMSKYANFQPYNPPKEPINPAQMAVDGMDKAEAFKNDPWYTAKDTLENLAMDIETKQQEKMMRKQAEAMQKQMTDQVKEQMEMAQRQMKHQKEKAVKKANSISLSDFSIKPAKGAKKIGSYNTSLVQVFFKGAHYQDHWVTKDIDPNAAKAINSFTGSDFYEASLANFNKVMKQLGDKIYSHGCPVLTVSNFNDTTKVLFPNLFASGSQAEKTTVELTKIENKKLKGEDFAPPKDYTELKMNNL